MEALSPSAFIVLAADSMTAVYVTGFVVLGILALLLFNSFFIVNQQTAAVVQRLGKFLKVAKPGLNFKWPIIDSIAGRLNLRVQQLNVKVETKTEDNVFVHVIVAVQYLVPPDKVY